MAYRAIYGNAFTEASTPGNERGLYMGICFRPTDYLRMDIFSDLFQFPWLRYRVDAPSTGSEQLIQCTYIPSKQSELIIRLRFKSKGIDQLKGNVNEVDPYRQFNWRIQFTTRLFPSLSIRARSEYCRYIANSTGKQEGFLFLNDLLFNPARSKWSGNLRLSYFETGGFESRVYAFENDVLYSFAIPAFSGKGFRYYLNLGFDALKNITFWARWAQTFYGDTDHSGSGNDQVNSNHKSEITLQLRCIF
jgi:hypothetical protein